MPEFFLGDRILLYLQSLVRLPSISILPSRAAVHAVIARTALASLYPSLGSKRTLLPASLLSEAFL